jgi:hypothetical protein
MLVLRILFANCVAARWNFPNEHVKTCGHLAGAPKTLAPANGLPRNEKVKL